jgi:microcystin-dependent protein
MCRVGIGRDGMGGVSATNRVTTAGSGIDGATLGAVGGVQNVALTSAQNGPHTHSATADVTGAHTHTVALYRVIAGLGAGGNGVGIVTEANTTTSTNGNHTHTITVASSGSGDAHNNMPPAIVCNFIVYVGV